MIENLNKYNKERKEYVQKGYTKNFSDFEIDYAIAVLAQSSMCPCIVVAFWIAEVLNYPDNIKKSVDNLIKFYRYKEIVGKPEKCPW